MKTITCRDCGEEVERVDELGTCDTCLAKLALEDETHPSFSQRDEDERVFQSDVSREIDHIRERR